MGCFEMPGGATDINYEDTLPWRGVPSCFQLPTALFRSKHPVPVSFNNFKSIMIKMNCGKY